MAPEKAETASVPASLSTPKTWKELERMRENIVQHFSDARIGALSDPSRSSEASELDSHIAQESWKRTPEDNDEDTLPPNVRQMAEQYLHVLGINTAGTSETVAGTVQKIGAWLRSAVSSLHF